MDVVRVITLCFNLLAVLVMVWAAVKQQRLIPVVIIPGSISINIAAALGYRLAMSWGWVAMDLQLISVWGNAIFLHTALVIIALYLYEGFNHV